MCHLKNTEKDLRTNSHLQLTNFTGHYLRFGKMKASVTSSRVRTLHIASQFYITYLFSLLNCLARHWVWLIDSNSRYLFRILPCLHAIVISRGRRTRTRIISRTCLKLCDCPSALRNYSSWQSAEGRSFPVQSRYNVKRNVGSLMELAFGRKWWTGLDQATSGGAKSRINLKAAYRLCFVEKQDEAWN